MVKEKSGICTTCDMSYGSSCSKWCAGCTLHKTLRVIIMVVALCAAYSFGEQIGTLRAMLMSGDSFTGGHAMMYRQHKDWDGNSRGEMMLYSDTPTATQAVTPPPITNPTVKTVIKSPVAKK